MTHEMADAMKHEVPEPPRILDPDMIMSVHRRQHRRRTSTVVGCLAIAAIALPTALLSADPGDTQVNTAASRTWGVSALNQLDPVPAEWTETLGWPPEQATRVATMSGDSAAYLYVEGDDLCVAHLWNVTRSAVPGGIVSCARPPATSLVTEGLVSGAHSVGPVGTDKHLVVVVPDGYTEVTLGGLMEPVSRNVAVFSWDYSVDVIALFEATESLVLEGAGLPTATVPVP